MKLIEAVAKYLWSILWMIFWTCVASASVGIASHDLQHPKEAFFWAVIAYFTTILTWVVMGEAKLARKSALGLLTPDA